MIVHITNSRPQRAAFILFVLVLTVFLSTACGGKAEGSSAAAPSASEDVTAADGERLFQSMGCVVCHNPKGTGPGPTLVGVFGETVTFNDGTTGTVDEAYIRRSILEPTAQLVKGYQPLMPSFDGRLDDGEISSLIAYIRSLE